MPSHPLTPVLDRFIDLMAQFGAAMDALVASEHGGGSVDERLALLEAVRTPAREARALLPELAALGARADALEQVDARLQAIDLSIDRFMGLARDGRVEESESTIGDHAAFLAAFADNLRKRRDARV